MHFTMFAVGSRGDIQPFVALGRGLQKEGHTVRLATHAIFESFVRENGLEFATLEGNPQALLSNDEGREWLESNRNIFSFAGGFRKLLGPVIQQGFEDAYKASEGTDVIIVTGPSYFFGRSVVEARRLPMIQAYVQPIHPTVEFQSALFPAGNGNNPIINYMTHFMGGQMFWQLLRPVVNRMRKELFNLPPNTVLGSFLQDIRDELPVVYGYSRHVLPKPKRWGDFLHVTGYWFLDQPEYTPPADLVDFLTAGEAPVYIGFGSMVDRDPERMTTIAIDALKKSGRRGLLLTGWGGINQSDLPDTIFKIQSAPHSWLFPRMSAVVHHGGAGTTAAGLRAGVPTVIIPFFGDQPFWAQRVDKLGVGTKGLHRKTLTADGLTQAIRATADPQMRMRAKALGECIEAENGVQRATEIITRAVQK